MRAVLLLVVACGHPAAPRTPPPEDDTPARVAAVADAAPSRDPCPPHRQCPDLGPWPYRPEASDVLVALAERGGGLARNPTYVVTIFRDGRVSYRGDGIAGPCEATDQLTPESSSQLGALLKGHDLLALADEYTKYELTDAESYWLAYSPDARRRKTIEHYTGDRSAPSWLRGVERGIERVVDVERWTGTRDARREAWFKLDECVERAP